MRNRVSDDMINVMLRQMGAASIKTTPAHINVAKFLIGDDLRLTYMYEVKEEEIYLQRISPYPMMIGKIYNEQQVVDIISGDLKKFKSAYKDVRFPYNDRYDSYFNCIPAFKVRNVIMPLGG